MGSFFGIDLVTLVKAVGLLGLYAIVFAESGLLIGFFLPGDSLLFTAGFLASQGYLNIWFLSIGCFIAAALGDSLGYTFGVRVGRRIFRRQQSFLFNPKHLERAERFYEAYGPKTIVLARFLPVIRTFAPILAGVGRMRYPVFLRYNLIGALIWGAGMPWAGYLLGRYVPGVDRFLIPIVTVVIIVSMIPSFVTFLREPERRAWLALKFRAEMRRPAVRISVGVFLVAFGFVALLLPLFPFAWMGFIGLELLGLRTMFLGKIRAFQARLRRH